MQNDINLNFGYSIISNDLFDVWFCEFKKNKIGLKEFDLLSLNEKSSSTRFATFELQSQFLKTRIFARKVLSLYARSNPENIRFKIGKYGKPYLDIENLAQEKKIFFNISHTASISTLAVSFEGEIGIDIEEKRNRKVEESLWNSVCSISEIAYLKSISSNYQEEEFLKIWTRKEAILKAKGIGFMQDPKEIEVYNNEFVLVVSSWRIFSIPTSSEYQASVAFSKLF